MTYLVQERTELKNAGTRINGIEVLIYLIWELFVHHCVYNNRRTGEKHVYELVDPLIVYVNSAELVVAPVPINFDIKN